MKKSKLDIAHDKCMLEWKKGTQAVIKKLEHDIKGDKKSIILSQNVVEAKEKYLESLKEV